MTKSEFHGVCPFCRSGNIEVESNTPVEWGNNDQGMTEESWHCLDCNRYFDTSAKVEVVERELIIDVRCPYCQERDYIESEPDRGESGMTTWHRCTRCNREFAIHPESWYTEGVE